ncbi:CAP domain-containing protein [Geminocystis herdmanii]|uniref:CAP domain-containing protein n=1 Tax=Geminocystis herdmanii TaxID=669359 RepID=UPI00034722C2|nr:CAP domain-containing protein [Geminocystis herdmanii]
MSINKYFTTTILTLSVFSPVSIIFSNPVNSQTDYLVLEKSIHQKVNQYRQSKKLSPLKFDSRISEEARKHSQNMANKTVPFSHQGFETRVVNTRINYRSVAENVAYNQGHKNPDQVAVDGWIKSLGHQKNMVGNFNLTGVGVAKNAQGEYYFTQIFMLEK